MKLGVLFSGGKDSIFACYKAMGGDIHQDEDRDGIIDINRIGDGNIGTGKNTDKNTVICLITLISENEDSYMFHTPNISRAALAAEAMGLPLITWPTRGEKEEELEDLKDAIAEAVKRYGIEGVVTGAIESIYQAARVQKICRDIGLWCFNPLWQVDQVDYLKLLLSRGFHVIITGVFAYPFDESWIGARLTEDKVKELERLQKRHQINPSGEGGELETFVLDGPLFHKRIEILRSRKSYDNYRGYLDIEEACLADKLVDESVDR